MIRYFLSVAIAVLACGAFAQVGTGFTLSGPEGSFEQIDSPTSGTVLSMAGANHYLWESPDNANEVWWWYRVEGVNSREMAFHNATHTEVGGTTATTYFVPSDGFKSEIHYFHDGPFHSISAIMKNVSQSTLTVSLFLFHDYDMFGTAANDAIGLEPGEPDSYAWYDTVGGTGAYPFFWRAEHEFFVKHSRVIGDANEIHALLTDGDADNLETSGINFLGPGDLAVAHQWTAAIDPGHSLWASNRITLVPEPNCVTALTFGLLGLGALRLRRHRPDTQ